MKNKLFLFVQIALLIGMLVFLISKSGLISSKSSDLPSMPKEEALQIAQNSDEVLAFSAMDGGRFAACLNSRVVKPCDSGWVTCIDDAWVVEFSAGAACGTGYNGSLTLRLLIDKNGKIISRFPEKEYFLDSGYCLEDYDCMSVVSGEEEACLNFIYGQLGQGAKTERACRCLNQKCLVEIPR